MCKKISYKKISLYLVLSLIMCSEVAVYAMQPPKAPRKKQRRKRTGIPGLYKSNLPSFQDVSRELFNDRVDSSNNKTKDKSQMKDEDNSFSFSSDEDNLGTRSSEESVSFFKNFNPDNFGFDNSSEFSNNFSFNNSQELPEESDTPMPTKPKRDSDFGFEQNNWPYQNNINNINNRSNGNNRNRNYNGFNQNWSNQHNVYQFRMQRRKQILEMQREIEAGNASLLLHAFVQYGQNVLTIPNLYRIKSFLLSLEETEIERFIKSPLVNSSLLALFKKCFSEIATDQSKTNTEFMNQVAAKAREKLRDIIRLFNLGISAQKINYFATFGFYWFDIIELLNMGIHIDNFRNPMSLDYIKAIVENKKYMRTFIDLGFTAKELFDSIAKLGKFHKEFVSLKKDNSKMSRLKRKNFMHMLAIQLRPFGSL